MRTGNAWLAVTYREAPAGVVTVTLLDSGGESLVEIAIPDAPWEESAGVAVEAMSAFRTEVEDVSEVWPAAVAGGEAFRLEVAYEGAGQKYAYSGSFSAPGEVPVALGRLLVALARVAGTALVGGRSRRAIEALERWGG